MAGAPLSECPQSVSRREVERREKETMINVFFFHSSGSVSVVVTGEASP